MKWNWFNIFKFGTPVLVLSIIFLRDFIKEKDLEKSVIKGKVTDIHIEVKGYIDFYVKGKKYYSFISNISNPNIIEVGDSVYKPSGTLTLKIIKQNGKTIFENMWYN